MKNMTSFVNNPFQFINFYFHSISSDFISNRKFLLNFPGTPKRRNNSSLEYPLKNTMGHGNELNIFLTPNYNLPLRTPCKFLTFLIHSPFELPGIYDILDLFEFDYGYNLEVLITPEIIRTDKDLRSLNPAKRGCYFEGERKLKYFQVYTRRNCEFECLSENFESLKKLNCKPFYMVRDNSTEICDYRNELEVQKQTFYLLRNITRCKCLDECDSIIYKTEVIAHSLVDKAATSINFKFKEVDVVPVRRYQPITFSDFLAQSGGMLGLFAGISVLSIFEIFYFLSLRWFVNFLRLMKTKLVRRSQ